MTEAETALRAAGVPVETLACVGTSTRSTRRGWCAAASSCTSCSARRGIDHDRACPARPAFVHANGKCLARIGAEDGSKRPEFVAANKVD